MLYPFFVLSLPWSLKNPSFVPRALSFISTFCLFELDFFSARFELAMEMFPFPPETELFPSYYEVFTGLGSGIP